MRSGGGSDVDVEHLATAIHPGVWVHAVRTDGRTVGRIEGNFRSLKSVSGAARGAAAFGMFAFRLGHEMGGVEWLSESHKASPLKLVKVRDKDPEH